MRTHWQHFRFALASAGANYLINLLPLRYSTSPGITFMAAYAGSMIDDAIHIPSMPQVPQEDIIL